MAAETSLRFMIGVMFLTGVLVLSKVFQLSPPTHKQVTMFLGAVLCILGTYALGFLIIEAAAVWRSL